MILKASAFILTLMVLSGLSKLCTAAPIFCKELIPSWAELQYEVPKEITYTSGLNGEQVTLSLGSHLGDHSAKIYLDSTGTQVIKLYKPKGFLPLRELFISKFFKEKHMSVADITDYSQNILIPDGKYQIIVKPFIKGWSLENYRTTNVPLDIYSRFHNTVTKFRVVFHRDFKTWLRDQPEYDRYHFRNLYIFDKIFDDFKDENWIHADEGWMLLDP